MLNRQLKGYVYAFAAVAIWSGFILVSRQGGISALSAYDVMAIRYVTASLLLFPVWFFWQRFNVFEIRFLICGLIGGLTYALLAFNGFERAPASHAAILLPGLLPLIIVLLNALFHHERYPLMKWFGIALISCGILLLLSEEKNEATGAFGHVFLIGAAVCWGIFSVLINRLGIRPWEATISIAFITCIVFMPVYLIFMPSNITVDLWGELSLQAFYQGIMATIVQMLFYVNAVQLIGSSRMGAMMAIVPILAGFGAIVLFDEVLTSVLIVALILVSCGVWFANMQFSSGHVFKTFFVKRLFAKRLEIKPK